MALQTTYDPDVIADDLIDKIGVHDSNHFEVKLDYSIDSNLAVNRYVAETYFFVPRSLGISKETYRRRHFYSDIQVYLRFKTPSISLQTLVSSGDPLSPLSKVRELLEQIKRQPRDRQLSLQLGQELRLFGAIVRAQLRDRVQYIRAQLKELAGDQQVRAVLYSDIEVECARFLEDVRLLTDGWRAYRADLLAESTPRDIRETYQLVDEFVSLEIEMRLTALLHTIDQTSLLPGRLRKLTSKALVEESEYRGGAAYETVVRDGSDNEHYLYRRGMLKKLVASVLWLELARAKEGSGVANMGSAIAAGVAMAVALTATILHSNLYLINTAGFVIAATITYMLKDRIKDWLKHFFADQLSRWLSDYQVRIRDPVSGQAMGRYRESFRWISLDEVPRQVLELRHCDSKSSIERLAKPENIIHYSRDVRLDGRALVKRLHLQDYDLNDIIRFGLSHFLARTDDAETTLPFYDPQAGKVHRRPFPKVYHLNLVMLLRSPACPHDPILKRIRVVFDKRGIRRLEQVSANG